MNKTRIYLAIIALLLVVIGIFVWQDQQKKKVPKDKDFAVDDRSEIHKIFLADKNERTITLTRNEDGWIVNGKHPVMPAKIDLILNTLEALRVEMPTPKPAWNNVIKDLAVKSTKVELFHKNEADPFKSFYIGGAVRNDFGNYMLMILNGKSAETPYIVSEPGFIGDLGVRFLLNEKDWRDTKVFNHTEDEISQITVDYEHHPEWSFVLKVNGENDYQLTGLDGQYTAQDKDLYLPGVTKYLSKFTKLNIEAFENDFVYKDSVSAGEPLVTITLVDKDKRASELVLLPMGANRRTKMQFDEYGNEMEFDSDRFYCLINDRNDFGIAQQYVFGKILIRRSDLYKK